MGVDTSALIAVLNMESESARVASAIEADANRLISAATVLDCFSCALARVTGEPLLFTRPGGPQGLRHASR